MTTRTVHVTLDLQLRRKWDDDILREEIERRLLSPETYDTHFDDDELRAKNITIEDPEAARDLVQELAVSLVAAWQKYVHLFGEPPHGTEKQLAALIELSGIESARKRKAVKR